MKTLTCAQGSTEWNMARAGVVTASEIKALVTSQWRARIGGGVESYLYQKAAERVMGYVGEEGGAGWAAGQGNILEGVARPWYEFAHGVETQRVGFCLSDDGKTGCSPDGLIGDDCGLELKCPQHPKHVEYLLGNKVPDAYAPQVQFSMWVTGRPRWVFVSYHQHLPKLVVVALRDPDAMKAFDAALAAFLPRLDAAEARIRAMMPAQHGSA